MSFAARLTNKLPAERRRTCSNCNRMGHQATTCTNQPTRIDRIGLEIEGFWFDLAAAKRKAQDIIGKQGTSDGSLRERSSCEGGDSDLASDGNENDSHVDDCDDEDCGGCAPLSRSCSRHRTNCKVCGARGWEFQTEPGTLGEALRQLTQVYPDVTSRAAGYHIHLSFKEKGDVTLLASQDFFEYFERRWDAWGDRMNVREGSAFWERLHGENQYCRPNSMSDWPIHEYGAAYMYVNRHNDRYRALNFHAWDEHTTVECRLLPMFQSAKLAVAATEELVAIVDDYLHQVVVDHVVESPDIPSVDGPISVESDFDDSLLEYGEPIQLDPIEGDVELSEDKVPSLLERKALQSEGIFKGFMYEMPTMLRLQADEITRELQRRNRA